MATSEIAAAAPAARFLGVARLDGFELGFRRRSIRWGGGSGGHPARARAAPCGACSLRTAATTEIEALDAKEGAGFAYRRREVVVEHDGQSVSAIAYDVINKEPDRRASNSGVPGARPSPPRANAACRRTTSTATRARLGARNEQASWITGP